MTVLRVERDCVAIPVMANGLGRWAKTMFYSG